MPKLWTVLCKGWKISIPFRLLMFVNFHPNNEQIQVVFCLREKLENVIYFSWTQNCVSKKKVEKNFTTPVMELSLRASNEFECRRMWTKPENCVCDLGSWKKRGKIALIWMRNVGGGITVNWIELNFENKRSYSGFRQREQQEAQHAMDLDFEFWMWRNI